MKKDTIRGIIALAVVFDLSRCAPTPYAVANGVYVNSNTGYCNWLILEDMNGYVEGFGIIHDGEGGIDNFMEYSIRPAMWIDISNLD